MQYSNFSLSLSFTVTDNISLQNIAITIGAYSHTPYMYLIHSLATNRIYLYH